MSDIDNTQLLKLIDEFIEIDENEEKDLTKLAQLGHELDHIILESDLISIVNSNNEEYNEILRLIVEDEKETYFIPAFTSIDEAKKGINELGLVENDWNYDFEVLTGIDILEIGIEDEKFAGIVVNPFNTDFIFPKEDLIKTATCDDNH